jgi:hypothetical protein
MGGNFAKSEVKVDRPHPYGWFLLLLGRNPDGIKQLKAPLDEAPPI